MTLAEEIKRLRAAAGLSQQALADAAGVSRSFIANIEQGADTRFGADTLFKLCDALKVECDHWRPFLAEATEAPVAKSRTKKAK